MARVQVTTTQYQFSHGKSPRGYGQWAFAIAGTTFWHTGTFAEAKAAAVAAAKAAHVSHVEVMP